jgi:hypothetical protein
MVVLAVTFIAVGPGAADVLAGGDVLEVRGQSYVESIDMLFNVRSGGRLSLGTAVGSVSVQTWSREQIRLVVTKRTKAADLHTARRILDEFSVRALHGGKDLTLEGRARTLEAATALGVEFTLWVPKSYNLAIRTRSGSIALPEVDGRFSAHTDAGAILLDCDTDELEIEVEDRSGELVPDEDTVGAGSVGSARTR